MITLWPICPIVLKCLHENGNSNSPAIFCRKTSSVCLLWVSAVHHDDSWLYNSVFYVFCIYMIIIMKLWVTSSVITLNSPHTVNSFFYSSFYACSVKLSCVSICMGVSEGHDAFTHFSSTLKLLVGTLFHVYVCVSMRVCFGSWNVYHLSCVPLFR